MPSLNKIQFFFRAMRRLLTVKPLLSVCCLGVWRWASSERQCSQDRRLWTVIWSLGISGHPSLELAWYDLEPNYMQKNSSKQWWDVNAVLYLSHSLVWVCQYLELVCNVENIHSSYIELGYSSTCSLGYAPFIVTAFHSLQSVQSVAIRLF